VAFCNHKIRVPSEARVNAWRLPFQAFSKVFGGSVAFIRMLAHVEWSFITKIYVLYQKDVSIPGVHTRSTALEEIRLAP